MLLQEASHTRPFGGLGLNHIARNAPRKHRAKQIRAFAHQDLLTDQQPVAVRVTLKGKRITVRLSYRFPVPQTTKPEEAVKPLGIDVGIALIT